MKKAGDILGEHDTRLWRVLFAHVDKAYAALDLSELVHLGVDEMNCRKGHDYLTIFADLVNKRVVYATEGKDPTTFTRFAEEILKHNGHPKAVEMVMSNAYQKGAKEHLGNAEIVFDPFHVSALVSEAVDEVRRREASAGPEARDALKKSIYLLRKNPENLTEKEQGRLDEMDSKHLATGRSIRRMHGPDEKGSRHGREAFGRNPGALDQWLVEHDIHGGTQQCVQRCKEKSPGIPEQRLYDHHALLCCR